MKKAKKENPHLTELKKEAREILAGLRKEWKRFTKDAKAHQYDTDPTAFKVSQLRYTNYIKREITDRGYYFSYEPKTGYPFQICVALAEVPREKPKRTDDDEDFS